MLLRPARRGPHFRRRRRPRCRRRAEIWQWPLPATGGERPERLPATLSNTCRPPSPGACGTTYRLLTIAGAGGCGKSRLALETSWALLDAMPNALWLVELASLSDLTQGASQPQPGLALPHALLL